MAKHPIVHVEISSIDHEAAGKFYHELFGWQIRQIPEMQYATFDPGDGTVGGGFNPVGEENPAGTITFYVHTDDINASLAKIEPLGGKVLSQPMEIPGVGTFAVFSDPTGNRIALLQPVLMGQ